MRHATGVGKACLAAGLLGIGVLSLVYGDFALQWQPVPKWVPWREGLAYASAVFLIVTSALLYGPRTATSVAFALTVYLLGWLLLLEAPRVAVEPVSVAVWLGFCETLAMAAGAWILYASASGRPGAQKTGFMSGGKGVRIATLLFALCLLEFGLSHLVYADFTATMVPAWLPMRVGFAYFTGAAHIAAGLGLLLGIATRLAATLEAIMMSTIVALVHLPGVAAEPSSRLQWTMLSIALMLAGAAWIVAGVQSPRSLSDA